MALLLEYTGYDVKGAQALVPQILTAVVHP
jgi:hypothetical protein